MDTSGGNVLAPWMVTQFEHLTCLELENFDSDNFDFEALLKECGVTDLLVVMDVAMVSEQTASPAERSDRDTSGQLDQM